MARSRTELKAELLAHADGLIDELPDWTEQTGQPTLTQIEEVVLQAHEAQRPAPGPLCPERRCAMHYKEQRQHLVRVIVIAGPDLGRCQDKAALVCHWYAKRVAGFGLFSILVGNRFAPF
ncbi:MAG TPA: hypothetical protein VJG32_13400 [Anaerolineae bacterium]|nr:hypothetical protein [Anaerolineae bacterium]